MWILDALVLRTQFRMGSRLYWSVFICAQSMRNQVANPTFNGADSGCNLSMASIQVRVPRNLKLAGLLFCLGCLNRTNTMISFHSSAKHLLQSSLLSSLLESLSLRSLAIFFAMLSKTAFILVILTCMHKEPLPYVT